MIWDALCGELEQQKYFYKGFGFLKFGEKSDL